jgi:hypothetical protein
MGRAQFRSGRKGQVWVIQKDELKNKEPKSPKSIFCKPNHYTMWNGSDRDLRVEKALGLIETDLPKVYAKLDKNEPITGLERVILTSFTSAMLSRVESQANWMAESYPKSGTKPRDSKRKRTSSPSLQRISKKRC